MSGAVVRNARKRHDYRSATENSPIITGKPAERSRRLHRTFLTIFKMAARFENKYQPDRASDRPTAEGRREIRSAGGLGPRARAVRGKNPRAVPLVITRAGTPVSNVIAAQKAMNHVVGLTLLASRLVHKARSWISLLAMDIGSTKFCRHNKASSPSLSWKYRMIKTRARSEEDLFDPTPLSVPDSFYPSPLSVPELFDPTPLSVPDLFDPTPLSVPDSFYPSPLSVPELFDPTPLSVPELFDPTPLSVPDLFDPTPLSVPDLS
ncbi:hypothetical protein Bbelb_413070 [Branchiostoma belcheri]|nr:hypothetical protein Bbelb_413070 [Branchiostoma belcheri]